MRVSKTAYPNQQGDFRIHSHPQIECLSSERVFRHLRASTFHPTVPSRGEATKTRLTISTSQVLYQSQSNHDLFFTNSIGSEILPDRSRVRFHIFTSHECSCTAGHLIPKIAVNLLHKCDAGREPSRIVESVRSCSLS